MTSPTHYLYQISLDFAPRDAGETALRRVLHGRAGAQLTQNHVAIATAQAWQCVNTGGRGRRPPFLPVSREKPLAVRGPWSSRCLPPGPSRAAPRLALRPPQPLSTHRLRFLRPESREGLRRSRNGFRQASRILRLPPCSHAP